MPNGHLKENKKGLSGKKAAMRKRQQRPGGENELQRDE
jgi:hypothetical protein